MLLPWRAFASEGMVAAHRWQSILVTIPDGASVPEDDDPSRHSGDCQGLIAPMHRIP